MNCTSCGNEVSKERLKAVPETKLCIECAVRNDVPKIRRFDDRSGEVVSETYFTHNSYIERQISEIMSHANIPSPHEEGRSGRSYANRGKFTLRTANEEFYTMKDTPTGNSEMHAKKGI